MDKLVNSSIAKETNDVDLKKLLSLMDKSTEEKLIKRYERCKLCNLMCKPS